MRDCDFRKVDSNVLATLFTSLTVYRISIVGDIKFPEGYNLFDLQLIKSTLSLTFRPVHDADPTASLPKIEADLLVIQLYSEGKPRYVLVNGSQLSPGMDAFIAALLEEDGKTKSNAQFLLDVCTDPVPEALAGSALVFRRRLTLSITHDSLGGRLVLKRIQRGPNVRSSTFECVMRSLGGNSTEHMRLTDERVRWTLIHLFGSSTAKALKRSRGASGPDMMPAEDPSKQEFLSFVESSFDRIYNIANEESHLDNHKDDSAALLVEQFHQKVDQ
ncbi:hypothetical protein AAVH_08901 [Aphelenchoides avenae]|nr:hypothetical protein AAVH_08901 [Aphelenchus avenae]